MKPSKTKTDFHLYINNSQSYNKENHNREKGFDREDISNHTRDCFIGYSNTWNFIKNTPLLVVISPFFSVFG